MNSPTAAPDPDFFAYMQRFTEVVPHNRALGLEMTYVDREGTAIMRLPWAEHLVGNPVRDLLHGGAVTSLIDACCGLAVKARLTDRSTGIATLDLRIDYLRPAVPRLDVLARAECYKITRQIAFVRCLAYHDDERQIASAAGSFVITRGAAPMVTDESERQESE